EILKEDGEMARLPDLIPIAKKFDLKIISIEDLIEYRLHKDSLITKEVSVKLPTEWGEFELSAYTQKNTGEQHVALIKGSREPDEPILRSEESRVGQQW